MTRRRVRVVDGADIERCLTVRHEVFVEEQGVPEDRELDGLDGEATHFLAGEVSEASAGAARLRPYDSDEDRVAKVERVAVRAERRGEGWGESIMDRVEAHARQVGYDRVVLDAQIPVVGFYERLGYETRGETFEDAGIPHREMEKSL
jgi:predicted GNAT family N-acyltransferase